MLARSVTALLSLLHLARCEERTVSGGDVGWGGWYSRNDGTMGGLSSGAMSSSGTFSGNVRFDNNGGFSCVQKSVSLDLSRFAGLQVDLCLRYMYAISMARVKSMMHAHCAQVDFLPSSVRKEVHADLQENVAMLHVAY